jgi:metal-responsive CopG/Arc/MetJ family transcriptional regulator
MWTNVVYVWHIASMSKRRSMPISVRLPDDLLAQLDSWIGNQRVPPNRARVMELALREFLDREDTRKGK